MKAKSDHPRRIFHWKEEPDNIRASSGIEPMATTPPVRCSTNWGLKSHVGSEVILLNSYVPASHRYRGGHGFDSRWSPDIFRVSSVQLLKLDKFTAMITLHFKRNRSYRSQQEQTGQWTNQNSQQLSVICPKHGETRTRCYWFCLSLTE